MILDTVHSLSAWPIPENAYVDRQRLALAVERGDEAYLRMALQGYVPNPVSYLTERDQHSIDLVNGRHLEVKGCGNIAVVRKVSLDQLLETMDQTRAHPDVSRTIEL
jgi:hypothetical protein